MIATPPEVNSLGYYELKETASLLAVSKMTVLRWTHNGFMKSTIRRANGRRIWSGTEILRVWKASK